MGSYNKWRVTLSTNDKDIINNIINAGRQTTYNEKWDSYALNKWTESSKWDPWDLICELSLNFPTVIFSVEYIGDNGSGKYFVLNGICLGESEIWTNPLFPTASLFNKRYKEKSAVQLARKTALEKAAAEKAAIDKQNRILEIEEELKRLKSS